jgi:hypothetical protein
MTNLRAFQLTFACKDHCLLGWHHNWNETLACNCLNTTVITVNLNILFYMCISLRWYCKWYHAIVLFTGVWSNIFSGGILSIFGLPHSPLACTSSVEAMAISIFFCVSGGILRTLIFYVSIPVVCYHSLQHKETSSSHWLASRAAYEVFDDSAHVGIPASLMNSPILGYFPQHVWNVLDNYIHHS